MPVTQKGKESMTASLAIGLSSWIINDGNCRDFAQGDLAAFALDCFAPEGLEKIDVDDHPKPSLIQIEGPFYEISGKCVHVYSDDSQSWCVIDAGILLYRNETPPEGIRLGSWWRGKIYVGVDHFFYLDRGSRHHVAPALIYDWKIDKVEIRTDPFKELVPGLMQRDPARAGWAQITGTNAYRDGINAEYLLHCTRQEGRPRRSRGRTGGRPPALSPKQIVAAKAMLTDPEITVEDVARQFKVTPRTLYNHLPGGRSGLEQNAL
jgi:hypothetical protein